MTYSRLAARACLVSLVQTLGVAVTAKHSVWMLATGGLIAWVWASNVGAMSVSRSWQARLAYAAGGAAGAGITWLLWR